jgi:hypothetical protein
MSAIRAGIVLYALSLTACDNLLGLHDIVPDGEPVALSFLTASTSVAQEPMGLITVTVLDVQGKVVPDFSGEVSLALGNNPSGATLLGALTATATRGIAHFDLVGIDRPGTGYTLIASTAGVPPGTSSAIDVVAPRFTPVPTGLAGGRIASVAVSPPQVGGTPTVFASADDGVYRSGDRGSSWKPARFGGHRSSQLFADPGRPGVVYSWNFFNLKKTIDGGGSWHDLGIRNAWVMALDPKDPSVIYIAGSEMRRSTDGGLSWTDLSGPSCTGIVVDAVIADTLYCSTFDLTAQRYVVSRSRDGGATWATTGGLGSPFYIATMFATPSGVFVNADGVLHRSIDAAGSWTRVLFSYAYAVAYAPSLPNRIYVASASGISVSNDGGASFGAPINAGDFVQSLAVDPVNPDLVYAGGSRFGVLVSSNGGVSWSPSSRGIDAHVVTSVAMAPGAPNTVLTTTGRGTLRTIDGGASWTTISQINVNVRFDPVVSTRAYQCGFFYFATSTDGGASFTGGNVADLASPCHQLLVAGPTFFAVGSGRLLKSIDSGASWTVIGLGTDSYVIDAALGDATGKVVVVATPDGIHRSSDGGASFTRVTDGYTQTIVTDPKMPTRIVGAQCPGFRLSTDGGASFGAVTGGAGFGSGSGGGCADKLFGAGAALYAFGTAISGPVLATSTDGGASWTPLEVSGLPDVSVTSMAVSEDGSTIYLGTTAGLYKGAAR